MKKKKHYRDTKAFIDELLKDPEIRIHYEEERIRTEIAYAIRASRVKAGLTQVELAKKVDTTQSVIARLESGTDKRIPSLPLLAKIARACGAFLNFAFSFKKMARVH